MIPFLDLKKLNSQYAQELKEATSRVIDSGWYINGEEVKHLNKTLLPIVEYALYWSK